MPTEPIVITEEMNFRRFHATWQTATVAREFAKRGFLRWWNLKADWKNGNIIICPLTP